MERKQRYLTWDLKQSDSWKTAWVLLDAIKSAEFGSFLERLRAFLVTKSQLQKKFYFMSDVS